MNYLSPFYKPQFEEPGISKVLKVTSLQDMINLDIIKSEQINNKETSIDPNMDYDDEM